LQGKRILILEDDFYLASDQKAVLERAGATVVGPFGSGCQEREILDAGELDGAIVDINLGKVPQFEFAGMLSERGVPFVFVTGYDAAVFPGEFSEAPCLQKPIRERELISTLASVIAEQRAEDG